MQVLWPLFRCENWGPGGELSCSNSLKLRSAWLHAPHPLGSSFFRVLCCEDFFYTVSCFSPLLAVPQVVIGLGAHRIHHNGPRLSVPQGHFSVLGSGTPSWKVPSRRTHHPPSSAWWASLCLEHPPQKERTCCVLQHPGTLSSAQRHSGHGLIDFWFPQLSITFPGFPGFSLYETSLCSN